MIQLRVDSTVGCEVNNALHFLLCEMKRVGTVSELSFREEDKKGNIPTVGSSFARQVTHLCFYFSLTQTLPKFPYFEMRATDILGATYK